MFDLKIESTGDIPEDPPATYVAGSDHLRREGVQFLIRPDDGHALVVGGKDEGIIHSKNHLVDDGKKDSLGDSQKKQKCSVPHEVKPDSCKPHRPDDPRLLEYKEDDARLPEAECLQGDEAKESPVLMSGKKALNTALLAQLRCVNSEEDTCDIWILIDVIWICVMVVMFWLPPVVTQPDENVSQKKAHRFSEEAVPSRCLSVQNVMHYK